jgi:hypothetical protein
MRRLFSGVLMLFLAGCASPDLPSRPGQGVMPPTTDVPVTQAASPIQSSVPSVQGGPPALSSPVPYPEAMPAKLSALPDLGPAPELNNEVWLNTEHPLRLADLGGKVVLVDMWTFG